jgi:hypothetical protein
VPVLAVLAVGALPEPAAMAAAATGDRNWRVNVGVRPVRKRSLEGTYSIAAPGCTQMMAHATEVGEVSTGSKHESTIQLTAGGPCCSPAVLLPLHGVQEVLADDGGGVRLLLRMLVRDHLLQLLLVPVLHAILVLRLPPAVIM